MENLANSILHHTHLPSVGEAATHAADRASPDATRKKSRNHHHHRPLPLFSRRDATKLSQAVSADAYPNYTYSTAPKDQEVDGEKMDACN